MTRGLAGPAVVCKTIRKGFDSLPRLHVFLEWPKHGPRFPDDYSKGGLARLALFHWDQHIKAATKAAELRDRLIAAQKELSALKRGQKEVENA